MEAFQQEYFDVNQYCWYLSVTYLSKQISMANLICNHVFVYSNLLYFHTLLSELY